MAYFAYEGAKRHFSGIYTQFLIQLCSTMSNTKTDPNIKLTRKVLMRERKEREKKRNVYLFLTVELNHLSPLSFSPPMWHWGMPLFPLSLDGKQTQLLIYCRRVYEFEWWGWGGRELAINGIVICPSFVCICKPLMSSISLPLFLSFFLSFSEAHHHIPTWLPWCTCACVPGICHQRKVMYDWFLWAVPVCGWING